MKKEELDFGAIWKELFRNKFLIVLISGAFAAASVFYALSIPNQYRSSAMVVDASSTKGGALSSLAGQFGGLANLAGISLGGKKNAAVIYKQIIAQDFITYFIDKRNIKIPLFVAQGWDEKAKKLTYEGQTDYNFDTNQWTRQVKYPKQNEPSAHEAYEKFMDNFDAIYDRKTNIITMSLVSLSPELAHQWLTWLIADFNEYHRNKSVESTARNIEYLKQKIQETKITEIQQALLELMQDQMKQEMLASVQENYLVSILDSPSLASKRDYPPRAIICVVGTFIGGVIGILLVVLRLFYRHSKQAA